MVSVYTCDNTITEKEVGQTSALHCIKRYNYSSLVISQFVCDSSGTLRFVDFYKYVQYVIVFACVCVRECVSMCLLLFYEKSTCLSNTLEKSIDPAVLMNNQISRGLSCGRN